jgi:hypothetical protein
MENFIQTIGYTVNDKDKLELATLYLQLEKDKISNPTGTSINEITGKGTHLTLSAVKKLIVKDFWDPILAKANQLKLENKTATDEYTKLLDTNLGITFGKEVIFHLMSQAGCEGLRFYYCKTESGSTSLVGVGVDANGKDIGADLNEIILPLRNEPIPTQSIATTRGSDTQNVDGEIYAVEVGPPITLRLALEEIDKQNKLDNQQPLDRFLIKTGSYFKSIAS